MKKSVRDKAQLAWSMLTGEPRLLYLTNFCDGLKFSYRKPNTRAKARNWTELGAYDKGVPLSHFLEDVEFSMNELFKSP